ncbi:Phosphoserine aminotransferase [Leucobacter sp. 7(1)]|uniref:phosphoserine transaminase n=1 Tax=Leucobacter sp. 7(1) TaxID=1255613 RepID=UPI00097EF5EC|nr:phosphoserine transaminase [Leucobacter sp. 7(1)]SJN08038.1 Phosphoserine aminotransferase [Leucobacter sp. 7(1)]
MTITIPRHLLPADGRFGSGPSRLRPSQLHYLRQADPGILGTSHRQAPVRSLVARIQEQLLTLFRAPAGYEVVLGNGGATAFWDIITYGLIEHRAQCLDFGVFGGRLARAAAAPWLTAPDVRTARHGELIAPERVSGIDLYAWPENETSTGVAAPVHRVAPSIDALTVIDATSSAGGMEFDAEQVDVYYFAPQKSLGSDGGLWLALLSPAAIERAERIAASGRYIPEFLSLGAAITNSRKHQTTNTPALATLLLLEAQLEWLLGQGGLSWAAERTRRSSQLIYDWAEASPIAAPFVARPAHRSPVTATIEISPRVSVRDLSRTLRANGIVDIDAYSGIGTNQLRVATYVSVEPDEVARLLTCIDEVFPRLVEYAC